MTESPDNQTTIINRVVQVVPDFAEALGELLDVHGGHISLSAVFGELAVFVASECCRVPAADLLSKIMELIEELLSVQDEETRMEIGASFLGNLPIMAITASLTFMGPETLNILESLESDDAQLGASDIHSTSQRAFSGDYQSTYSTPISRA